MPPPFFFYYNNNKSEEKKKTTPSIERIQMAVIQISKHEIITLKSPDDAFFELL